MTIGQGEVLVELVNGLVELVVGVVDNTHVEVCHSVGIVGCQLYDLGEIAAYAYGVIVAFDGIEAKVEVYVWVVGIELGESVQLVGGFEIAFLVIVLNSLFHALSVGGGHGVGTGGLCGGCCCDAAKEQEQEDVAHVVLLFFLRKKALRTKDCYNLLGSI